MPVRSFLILVSLVSIQGVALAKLSSTTENRIDISNWRVHEKSSNMNYQAIVPGTVHTDLFRNGLIGDPYFGTNEKSQQWIETKTWVYSTEIYLTKKTLKEKHIELVFEGLDTYADVYLNDSLLFTAENMFVTYTVDVKKIIRTKNRLRIEFHPASELIEKNKALSPIKKYPGGDRVFIRKAQYQFGWDWGPRFVTCGIWKPVSLVAWSDFRITDAVYTLKFLTKDTAYMMVDFMFQSDKPGVYDFKLSEGKNTLGTSKYQHRGKTNEHLQVEFKVPNPRLWWCNGLGKPEMYEFTLITRKKKKYSGIRSTTGIRKIELSSDRIDNDGSFTFILNDVPVFAKGANWIPSDNFLPRIPDEKIARQLKDMRDLNMNMVRVWGGGAYESDHFYEQCDSLGLMVWQDLMFACSMYPYRTLDRNNMLTHEINDNYRRLASHPCMALWCGDNENREGWFNWGWQKQMGYSAEDSTAIYNEYLEYQLKFMATLNRTDPFFPYLLSSPQNGWGRKIAYERGDVHYWGVWWGMEPFSSYETHTGRFVSEFGFQGAPSFHTFQEMGAETSKWFADSTIQLHQKHPTGYQTIETYMKRDYGITPNSFEDYIYLSQVMQRDAMTTAIEAQRRNMPQCMGSLFWQYNDCWPVTSWSVVDYFGRRKLAWYELPRLYAPILVSIQETSDSVFVWIVNERNMTIDTVVSVRHDEFDGDNIFEDRFEVRLSPFSSAIYWRRSKKDMFAKIPASRGTLNVDLLKKGGVIYFPFDATAVFAPAIELELPDEKYTFRFMRGIVEGEMTVRIRAEQYLRQVMLTCDDPSATFSENGFDLRPMETKIVKISFARDAKLVEESFTMTTMNRVIRDEKAEQKNEMED